MAIVITSLDKPVNVVATPVAGGTLDADTTYYIIVTAKLHPYSIGIGSDISVEISFLTTTVNKSADVTWDAVPGANGYLVYISTISGDYEGSKKLGALYQWTTQTNSYSITSITTTVGLDAIGYSGNLLGNLPKDVGQIDIAIDGSNETIESLTVQLDIDGYSDRYFYDGRHFIIKGNIQIRNTGRLTANNFIISILIGGLYFDATSTLYANDTTLSMNGYSAYLDGSKVVSNRFKLDYKLTQYNQYFPIMYSVPLTVRYDSPNMKDTFYWCDPPKDSSLIDGCFVYSITNAILTTNFINSNITVQTYSVGNSSTGRWIRDSILTLTWGGAPHFGMRAGSDDYDFYDCIFKYANSEHIFTYAELEIWQVTTTALYDLNFHNSISLYILDKDSTPLEFTSVKIYGENDALLYDLTTDIDGYVKQDILKMTFHGNGTTTAERILYDALITIVISKTGYETYTSKFDLSKKFDEIITLEVETSPIRVFEKYEVDYLPTPASLLRYVNPDTIPLKYVAPTAMNIKYVPQTQVLNIEYIPSEESTIRYIQPETIKIEYQCKP